MNSLVTLSCSSSKTTTGTSVKSSQVESNCWIDTLPLSRVMSTFLTTELFEVLYGLQHLIDFYHQIKRQMGRATSTRRHDCGRQGNDIRIDNNPIQCNWTKLHPIQQTQLNSAQLGEVVAFLRHSWGEVKGEEGGTSFFILYLALRRQLSEGHKSTPSRGGLLIIYFTKTCYWT